MITQEQKQIVQDNITHYIRNNCVMSKHSLDIIEKMLDENTAQVQEILELKACVNDFVSLQRKHFGNAISTHITLMKLVDSMPRKYTITSEEPKGVKDWPYISFNDHPLDM